MSDTAFSPVRPASLFEKTMTRLFLRPAEVTEVVALSPGFRRIRLQGEALRGQRWSPGDKLQIKLEQGMASRTYTPMHWDSQEGSTSLLCYCQGEGPGRDWVRQATAGQSRHVFGPRASMPVPVKGPVVIFGDETSAALAAACLTRRDSPAPHLVFEAHDADELRSVLGQLGLSSATVLQRQPDDAHLAPVARLMQQLGGTQASFLLSGNALSIQQVLRALKQDGISVKRIHSKAYWALGKTGLD